MAVSIPCTKFPLEKKNKILEKLTFQVADTKPKRNSTAYDITCLYFYDEKNNCFTFPTDLTKKAKQAEVHQYNIEMEKCIDAPTLSIPFWFARTKCKFFPLVDFKEYESKFTCS